MPIILKTEQRSWKTVLFVTGMYLLLGVGAVTMIYPFLLMVSGSVKSRLDANELNVVPRYLHDEGMLYRKYTEAKYNEDLQLYLMTTGDPARSFRDMEPPPGSEPGLLEDWRTFLDEGGLASSFYTMGFGPTLEGKIIQENERAFRNHVRKACHDDLTIFRESFEEPIENWFFLKLSQERLTDRTYQVSPTPLMDSFYQFKAALPQQDRIYASCDGAYRQFLRLRGGDTRTDATLSSDVGTDLWEAYVREVIHPQFVRVAPAARPAWARMLEKNHRTIELLNGVYGTHYPDFSEVPFPEDRIHAGAALTDYLLFIADPDMLETRHLSVETPETQWRAFLEDRYPDLERAGEAHGRTYASFDAIPMPQRESDLAYCMENRGALRAQFLTRNFAMVFEYILIYGQGIRNTVIYCSLAVLLALLVNPMAAYALSRYNLPSQYKVLLFLIATMAFPAVVTMIPNFLLLRDLRLLNTFAALLLPGMANGYAIFLLKGFFDSLPRELYEAADIDGAGEWQKFWLITMNCSKPILAVIALGAFTGAYANFMYAFILCQDRDMWTLMVWLYQLQQFSSQGVVFASLLVAAVPTLVVFVLCQNVIIRGIVVPTEK
jgi:multiple sugar transport system permease protein